MNGFRGDVGLFGVAHGDRRVLSALAVAWVGWDTRSEYGAA